MLEQKLIQPTNGSPAIKGTPSIRTVPIIALSKSRLSSLLTQVNLLVARYAPKHAETKAFILLEYVRSASNVDNMTVHFTPARVFCFDFNSHIKNYIPPRSSPSSLLLHSALPSKSSDAMERSDMRNLLVARRRVVPAVDDDPRCTTPLELADAR